MENGESFHSPLSEIGVESRIFSLSRKQINLIFKTSKRSSESNIRY